MKQDLNRFLILGMILIGLASEVVLADDFPSDPHAQEESQVHSLQAAEPENWKVLKEISGKLQKTQQGTVFLLENGEKAVNTFLRHDYHWYYFDSTGSMAVGWRSFSDGLRFFGEGGRMAQQWQLIEGKLYFFETDGLLRTGDWAGNRYMGADGAWIRGAYRSGWQETAVGRKYIRMDGSTVRDGMEKIGSKTYYFNQNGYVSPGWHKDRGSWFYFDASAGLLTGWQKIEGDWYYLLDDGRMFTGWKKSSNRWQWFDQSGRMAVGWKKINEKWYYFNSGGLMVTGWRWIDGCRYHFRDSGIMDTDWTRIRGKHYYFDQSGALQMNAWVGYFYVDENGAWDTSVRRPVWKRLGLRWWYCHSDQSYTVNDFELIDGEIYYFDRKGYMVTGWQEIKGEKYHFDRFGVMNTGWQRIGFRDYFFYNDGTMAKDTWIQGRYLNDKGICETERKTAIS